MSLSHTEDVERLRRQAQRALRLARGINDERVADALRAPADLLEQVKSVEQQEAQNQPKDEDKKD